MSRVLLVVLTVCLISTVVLGADQRDYLEIRLSAGLANPTGDLVNKEIDNQNAGHAGGGFNIGIDLCVPTDAKGVGFIYSYMYSHNSVNATKMGSSNLINNSYEEYHDSDPYISRSVLFGVKYQTPFQGKISLFITGQVGFNFLETGKIEYRFDDSRSYRVNKEKSATFGFAIGGGITLNRFLSLQVRYLSFRGHSVEGKSIEDEYVGPNNGTFNIDKSIPVSLLTTTLQLHLPTSIFYK
jgi:Outer membrane protein beta-barrel domain